MRRLMAVLAVLGVLSLGLTACGGSDSSNQTVTTTTCPTNNTKAFPKTRFVADVGLIAGSFHHWIWKPYKAGKFKKGAHGRVFALVKAAGTAALIKHYIGNARDNVKADPTLCKTIGGTLDKLAGAFDGLGSKLRSGDIGSLLSINGLIGSVTSAMGSGGMPVKESYNS